MPIYEFFCPDCNTIFNFYSRRLHGGRRPDCPACGRKELEKQLSTFATIGRAKEPAEGSDDPLAGIDEARMEQAMESLMREAEGINENDPRQMVNLMRKFSEKTGVSLGGRMEEALARMEAGEDPETLEQEMGDLLEGEDAFSLEAFKAKVRGGTRPPRHDQTLYELD
ncbi:MAG: hypothetical protein BWK76_13995 [Desulfobulbaceae bacterium A2]|nr:MAG: hypothetical protein BWK76_13995 [Desulfobulbaceae bacterium A2]